MVMEAAEEADKSRKDADTWKEKYRQQTTKLAQAEQKVEIFRRCDCGTCTIGSSSKEYIYQKY